MRVLLVLLAACGRIGFDSSGGSTQVDAPPSGEEPTNYVLDPGFGTGGYTIVDGGNLDEVPSAAIVMGSRLFAAGYVRDTMAGRVGFELLAFAETGGLDTTIGQGGRFIANHPPSSISDFGFAVARRHGMDQFYVAGDGEQTQAMDDMQVARFSATGELDTTFGSGGFGHVHVNGQDSAHAVVVDDQDRIIACGSSSYDNNGDTTIVRFLPSGQLDPNFAANGVSRYVYANTQWCEGIAIAPDGNLWLAGSTGSDIMIARMHPGGGADTSFANNSRLVIPNGAAMCVAALGDNVATAGTANNVPSVGVYDPTGAEVWVTAIQATGMEGMIEAILVDDHGRVVIGGYLGTDIATPERSFVARLMPTGEFDPTFGGTNGVVFVDVPGADHLEGLAIDASNRIYATGHIDMHQAFAFRLQPN